MLLLRLLQRLIATLNSEGTPAQVASGIALGSILGLTPLLNLHNLLVLGIIFLFNVSFPAAMLGWIFFAPVGFLLDPVFHAIGETLLGGTGALHPVWTALYNLPVIPLSNYNNTVVLGSLVGWLLLVIPIYILAKRGLAAYRTRVLPRIQQSRFFKVMKASKLYSLYRLFHAE
jgi:uncharacterized protein (TIGR03546 family)